MSDMNRKTSSPQPISDLLRRYTERERGRVQFLAEEFGVDVRTLRRWVRGESPISKLEEYAIRIKLKEYGEDRSNESNTNRTGADWNAQKISELLEKSPPYVVDAVMQTYDLHVEVIAYLSRPIEERQHNYDLEYAISMQINRLTELLMQVIAPQVSQKAKFLEGKKEIERKREIYA